MVRILLILLLVALGAGSLSAQQTDDCLECHGVEGFIQADDDEVTPPAFVDPVRFGDSVHGDLDCVDCHGGIEVLPHVVDLPRVECAECHEEAQEAYAESVHASAPAADRPAPAGCTDCHGTHYTLYCDDPESIVRPVNIENVCGGCHARPEVMGLFGRSDRNPLLQYTNSVHGRSLRADPDMGSATCTNCHGYHGIHRKIDLRSKICDSNIPDTCGACHEQQNVDYRESTHWRAVERGHHESPVCNDCHGGHAVASIAELDNQSDGRNQRAELCRGCHSSEILMERFGLDAERFESYMKTYHALAARHGSSEAAVCTSCHETHAIRSQADPESSIHPARLKETCRQCHEGATERFARIPIHPVDQKERNPIAFWINRIYILVILVVVGAMLVHNGVILFYYIRLKHARERKAPAIQRFRRFEVVQHGLLIVSFLLLAVTGFALKFPDAFWVEWIAATGLTEAVRSSVHRIAAVVMIACATLQTAYLVGSRRGRDELSALRPTLADVRHLFQNMRYHLALGGEKPASSRFDYAEKIEYIALAWGVVVMTGTGSILWFPEFFAGFLPWWAFEAVEIIHLLEAILAVLAVVFWHLFFVIFHPEYYPMKLTWLHGKISEADLESHHPADRSRIERREGREK